MESGSVEQDDGKRGKAGMVQRRWERRDEEDEEVEHLGGEIVC